MKSTFLLIVLLLVSSFLVNCYSPKSANGNMTDDEKAAQLLKDQMPQKGFKLATYVLGHTKYIQIQYSTNNSIGGQSITLDMTYDDKTKSWTAKTDKQNNRAGTSSTQKNLSPKSGWLGLIKKLLEKDFLSIRDAQEMGYQKIVADGDGHGLDMRIEDQQRRISHANPVIHAQQYPEFKDLKTFAEVTKIFWSEFDLKYD